MQSLRTWLSSAKWHEHHPVDDPKFYDFIAAVWDETQRLWDEIAAKDLIASEAEECHPELKHLVPQAVTRAHEEGTLILDFLCRMKEQGRNLA